MKTKHRESGIETLKIIAMILIVISHVTQTLGKIVSLSSFPTLFSSILTIFRLFGPLGNTVFFVCTAWFLFESDAVNKKKWFSLLVEVWFVSVLILVITFVLRQGQIDRALIIRSLFPTIFQNNWYLTCYMLFYPIHPFLNSLIQKFTPKTFFRVVLSLLFLYFGFAFLFSGKFYCTDLVIWITIYFIVAYMRKYPLSLRSNTLLLVLGLFGLIGLPFLCSIGGSFIPLLSDKTGHLVQNNNPLLLLLALSLFNIAKRIHFKNTLINSVSSFSLLVYIIHENLILRRIFRMKYIQHLLDVFGQTAIILPILIFSAIIFLFALTSAWIYHNTLRKLVFKAIDSLYGIFKKYYLALENRFHS